MISLNYLLFEAIDRNFTVYFDMDGVLANFQKGTMQNYKVILAKEKLELLLMKIPNVSNFTEDQLKTHLSGKQTDPKMNDLKKAFNDFNGMRFKAAGEEGFFKNLEPMDGSREMLLKAKELTGHLPDILTAPVEINIERCEKEKYQWMMQHFDGLFNRFICEKNKFEYASPNSILIDDREKFLKPFIVNGGIGILHKTPKNTMELLEKITSNN